MHVPVADRAPRGERVEAVERQLSGVRWQERTRALDHRAQLHLLLGESAAIRGVHGGMERGELAGVSIDLPQSAR